MAVIVFLLFGAVGYWLAEWWAVPALTVVWLALLAGVSNNFSPSLLGSGLDLWIGTWATVFVVGWIALAVAIGRGARQRRKQTCL